MFRKKKKKRPEISAPKNFEHRVHTSFDAKRGCFVGLPTQWQSLIENLRRPRPMVDPSRITEVELRPKKVEKLTFITVNHHSGSLALILLYSLVLWRDPVVLEKTITL